MPGPLDGWAERIASVHLVGIGGVGMAGLAVLMRQHGFQVSGSDQADSPLCQRLREMGVQVTRGHRAAVAAGLDWAVRTPAVSEDNPEVAALRNRGIPVYTRGHVLAAYSRSRKTIAVTGAHGKTTTSALTVHLLRAGGVDAGYAVGGETTLPGAVAGRGESEWFVCEADESDGTLVGHAPDIGVLTHVEWDHIERFRTEASLLAAYRRFASRCGTLWIREDDAAAAELARAAGEVRRTGQGAGCEIVLKQAVDDPRGQRLEMKVHGKILSGRLPLPGLHNACNACMAVGAAVQAGVDPESAVNALASFGGVGRRFECRECGGVTVIQDYAHHPTELRAAIASARALRPRRLLLVFQPHRYSRTRHLLTEFADSLRGADRLDLLPVYAASERPEQGADSQALAGAVGDPIPVWTDRGALVRDLIRDAEEGDVILLLGAGDIGALQARIVSGLETG